MPPSGPQVACEVPGTWHTLPWQQPVVHEVASQMHMPPEQRWPAAHGALVPHMQLPPVQRSACVGLHTLPAPQPPQCRRSFMKS